ncbi:MAG: DUF423 domain-containing protein [Caulobacterales bacterium]
MRDATQNGTPITAGHGASLILAGAILGFLAIAFGAFGAHAIEHSLSAEAMGWWRTAGMYHLPLSAATVTMGALTRVGFPGARGAGWCFVVGVIVFAGSLYALALTGARWLGAVTPIGGLAMMAGFLCLALGAWKARNA